MKRLSTYARKIALVMTALVACGVLAYPGLAQQSDGDSTQALPPTGAFIRNPDFREWKGDSPLHWGSAADTIVERLGEGIGLKPADVAGQAKLTQYWSKSPSILRKGDMVLLKVRVRCAKPDGFRVLVRIYEEGTSTLVSGDTASCRGDCEWQELNATGIVGTDRFDLSIALVTEGEPAEVAYVRGYVVPEMP